MLIEKIQLENFSKNKIMPILVKIAPDLSQLEIDDILDVCIKNKVDGIIATNTTISKENLNNGEDGGLSGKPLFEKSNHIINYYITIFFITIVFYYVLIKMRR